MSAAQKVGEAGVGIVGYASSVSPGVTHIGGNKLLKYSKFTSNSNFNYIYIYIYCIIIIIINVIS